MNALTRLERLDDMFPELFRRFMQPMSFAGTEPLGEIRIDIDENDKSYTVKAEVPGAKKDDIRVEVDGNRVSIAAEVRKDREEKEPGDKGRVLVRETYRGSVSRSFTLAQDIDETGVAAKLEDGVLKLTLPKRAGSRNRQIAIE
jgi:HSP20 family protein